MILEEYSELRMSNFKNVVLWGYNKDLFLLTSYVAIDYDFE